MQETTENVKELFQGKLDELKVKDYRRYKNLAGELFEWGAALSSNLGGNGTLGDLVEEQIRYISSRTKRSPIELVNNMFEAYIKGNDYAFTSLFYN